MSDDAATAPRADLPVIAATLAQIGVPPRFLVRAAQRTRSTDLRELITLLGSWGLDDDAHPSTDRGHLAPHWASALAEVLVAHRAHDDDLETAETYLRTAFADAPRNLRPEQQALYVDVLLHRGQDEEVRATLHRLRRLTSRQRSLIRADLANPFRREAGNTEAAWLELVNMVIHPLHPLALRTDDGLGTPFDRLSTVDAPPAVTTGPLVSVVVSSYRPAHSLLSAVRSLVDQSWQNLEILVVDDASGEDFTSVYDEVASMDPRIRVIRQDTNQGTYGARNRALAEARGTYATFQDSDDWSHPERIARQVAVLESDPLAHSTRTWALRLADDLTSSRLGNSREFFAAATLMFRREPALRTLGAFDTVRKAADTEFHRRLDLALPGRTVDLPESLLVTRTGGGSLSRDEFAPGWRHPARLAYESSYAHWHHSVRAGAPALLEPDAPRAFPAPARYLQSTSPAPDLDVVVLADWRHDGPIERDAADLAARLADQSLRVGVLHVERLALPTMRPRAYITPLRHLIARGAATLLTFDQVARTALAVVSDASCLSFLPSTPAGLEAARVVVLTDHAPGDGGIRAYDPAFVETVSRERLHGEVTWSPRTTKARRALAPLTTGRILSSSLDTSLPPLPEAATLRHPEPSVAVVLTDDSAQTFAEAAEIVAALVESGLDVRARGSDLVRSLLTKRSPAPGPLVFDPREITERALVATSSDVVVVGADEGTSLHRLIDEAVQSGARVFAPRPRLPESTTVQTYVGPRDLLQGISADPTPVRPHRSTHGHNLHAWYLEATTPRAPEPPSTSGR